MAEENHDWGYWRIQGALFKLGDECARSTIADILRRHGIELRPSGIEKRLGQNFSSGIGS
jgi:hypothetical protein